MLFSIFFVLICTYYFINYINKKTYKIIDSYISIDVKNIITNIVNISVADVDFDSRSDYLIYDRNSYNEIVGISYDTNVVNDYSNKLISVIQKNLLNLENGKLDDFYFSSRYKVGKYKNIKNGLLTEISLGTINGLTILSNIGPTIPIKLVFTGNVSVTIDASIKEYGINNSIITLYANVIVDAVSTMPISSRIQTVKVRRPVSVNIIKGNIPNFYSSLLH